jgi:HEAT repeat protein
MISIEFLIVISLAVGATFFVSVVSMGLVVNKWVEQRVSRSREQLYRYYSGLLADLLLQPLPDLSSSRRKSALFDQYEELLGPVKSGLSWSSLARKGLHRAAIRKVLIDFSTDLTGESMDRLQYFFYSLDFVDEEIRLLDSKHWWIRAQAARNLGLLRARRGNTALTRALEDRHDDVRNQAMQSLVVLVGVEALGTIFQMMKGLTRWTALGLSIIVRRFEDKSLPYLTSALKSSDQSVVLFAIEMLSEIGFVEAVNPLVAIAEAYPNVMIRSAAIVALGRLGDERSEPLLRELLANPYPTIRSSAVRALERVGSPASIPQLKERVMVGDVPERISAARALAKSGKSGLEELRMLAKHPDNLVHGVALHVLEEAEGFGPQS